MAKFRKRPIVIEAKQWFPPDWEGHFSTGPDRLGVAWDGTQWWIRTLEGSFEVTPGDWIITGIRGEKYLCRPDIFAAIYERVD